VIRLVEMTEKLKCFSDMIERSGNTSNVPVGCRMIVKKDSSIILESIECSARVTIEHSSGASNVHLRYESFNYLGFEKEKKNKEFIEFFFKC
jgi:hypothetical protein